MMKNHVLLFLYFLMPFVSRLFGQQVIRGSVKENATQQPLAFSNVCLFKDSILLQCKSTDEKGIFRFDNLSFGVYHLTVSFVGYKTQTISNIYLQAGKDKEILIELLPITIELKGIEVTDSRGILSHDPMAMVSARSFTTEETELFVGSRFDPARMAANYAGVQGADDSRNDIIIRGNSPLGVLWRIEGIPVPNPNHFAVSGTTGGPVTIINNKVLANSDFYTGAFPSEFGNAIAGVFDLKMRNGNNEKYQFATQIGFLGTELMAEGPLKKSHSSFLTAYRYSTLALFGSIGFNIGTNAIPRYQDINFKLFFPLKNGGNISVFGIGGISDIDIVISRQKDTSEIDLYGQNDRDQYFGTRMATTGISYTQPFREKGLWKNVIAFSHENQHAFHQYIARHVDSSGFFVIDSIYDYLYFEFAQNKLSYHTYLNFRPHKKWWIKGGILSEYYFLQYNDSQFYESPPHWEIRWNTRTTTYLLQPYGQMVFSPSAFHDITLGIHGLYFGYNHACSFPEPRIGWQWKINEKHSLSAGAGLHSQLIPLYLYFYQHPDSLRQRRIINHEIGPMKSIHYVTGYTFQGSFRFRTEIYYQYLFEVPIETQPSAFSLVNQGSSFSRFFPGRMKNTGTGYNYGIEITTEKFAAGKYFFMLTTTFYQSRYKGSDNIERHTDFNGQYIGNLLSGKIWRTGSQSWITIGTKITYAGNRRYGLVDTLQTYLQREIVFMDSLYNEFQFPPYFRVDFKIQYTWQRPRISHEIGLDLLNLTSHKNILNYTYAPTPGSTQSPIRLNYQLGFLPLFYYRMNFQVKQKSSS